MSHQSDDSTTIEVTGCPVCPSSDAFTIYEKADGQRYGHCYSCTHHTFTPYEELAELQQNETVVPRKSSTPSPLKSPKSPILNSVDEGLQHPIRSILDRALSYLTCEHYGVRVGVSSTDGETPIYHLYPIVKNNQVVGWKQRFTENGKDFISVGDTKNSPLFGSHLVPNKGKKIWITEGELDALSCYQVLKESSSLIDWNPPVVSLPHGAASASKCITENIDFLNKFDEIILVFDNDEPGRQARDSCLRTLAGKVYYLELPYKDPNEMLMAGKGEDLKWALLTKYKKYQPDGIVNAKDLWERYKEKKNVNFYPYPSSMPNLNKMTYGARDGTIVTITAGTGSGKTQFLRELMHHFYVSTTESIAGIYLEEDISDTLSGLLAIHLNRRINLPDVNIDEEEESKAFESLFGSGRISLYDYFGGMDDSSLLGKLRYFAATGHKFIFLDHLSIVVSEYAAEGGERERIDTLMTKLAKFVKEYNVILFLVVHLRKTSLDGLSFEEGAPPGLDDLRGSGSLKQLSWDILGASRPQQHPDPACANTTELRVLKCRLTGRTGIADYLYYSDVTGRMIESQRPVGYRMNKRKLQGGSTVLGQKQQEEF
jgi:twinkle protein